MSVAVSATILYPRALPFSLMQEKMTLTLRRHLLILQVYEKYGRR